MKTLCGLFAFIVCIFLSTTLVDAREFCTGDELCIPDTLEVEIQTDGDPVAVLVLDAFEAGRTIDAKRR